MDKIGVSAPATDPQTDPSDPKLVDLLTRSLVDFFLLNLLNLCEHFF